MNLDLHLHLRAFTGSTPLCALLALLLSLTGHPARAAGFLREPSSFSGSLPCADCTGIDWHIDLWPDGRFHLRRAYQDRDGRDDDIGRWRLNPADGSLLLFGGREAPTRLAVIDATTLRLLRPDGLRIQSSLPYELNKLPAFAPAEIVTRLGGEFRYFADAATLRECRTGHSYPVLMEGGYLAAERRYLAAEASRDAGPGTLFLRLTGRIVNRQVMEGEGPMQSLSIQHLVADSPEMRCEQAMSKASLPNTYWRLRQLQGERLGSPGGARELHFVLHDGRQSIVGFAGCNRFTGSYEVAGNRLSIGDLAATRMACPEAHMETDRIFHQALGQVAGWRIQGQTLELHDGTGRTVMVLDAVYLP